MTYPVQIARSEKEENGIAEHLGWRKNLDNEEEFPCIILVSSEQFSSHHMTNSDNG